MKNSSTNTELNPDSTTIETENDLGVEAVTAADLGYDEPVTPPVATIPSPVAAPAVPTIPSPVTPVETPVTGYGKPTVPAVPAAPVVPPVVDPAAPVVEETPEQKTLKAIETEVSSLGDQYNKKNITDFAVANKLLPEQVKAYVDQIKASEAESIKANEERITAQRQAWNNELIADKDFGGANFDTSTHEVEQLIQKYMPNVKKQLTDKKGMLPPSFMKDLLTIAKALKPAAPFEGGEAPAEVKDEDSYLDDMYS